MAKYRIASVQWWTVFNEPVVSPTVQMRVGLFWWVTIAHCESVKQAITYIRNIEKRKTEKILGIIVK